MAYKNIIGKYGESIAEKYLISKGYKIKEKNVRIGRLEIDIIANIKEKLIFIEVKTRASDSLGPAQDNFSQKKLKLMKKAIGRYVDKYGFDPDKVRLDLIAVDLNRPEKMAKIKHWKDIF